MNRFQTALQFIATFSWSVREWTELMNFSAYHQIQIQMVNTRWKRYCKVMTFCAAQFACERQLAVIMRACQSFNTFTGPRWWYSFTWCGDPLWTPKLNVVNEISTSSSSSGLLRIRFVDLIPQEGVKSDVGPLRGNKTWEYRIWRSGTHFLFSLSDRKPLCTAWRWLVTRMSTISLSNTWPVWWPCNWKQTNSRTVFVNDFSTGPL